MGTGKDISIRTGRTVKKQKSDSEREQKQERMRERKQRTERRNGQEDESERERKWTKGKRWTGNGGWNGGRIRDSGAGKTPEAEKRAKASRGHGQGGKRRVERDKRGERKESLNAWDDACALVCGDDACALVCGDACSPYICAIAKRVAAAARARSSGCACARSCLRAVDKCARVRSRWSARAHAGPEITSSSHSFSFR